MRPSALVTLAMFAGCGGGGAKATTTPAKGSLFDEHVARGGGPYPVPELAGDVTCYGGTASTRSAVGASDGDVETYVRRAVDGSTATIVEDVVSLNRGNPTPFRYQITITGSDDFEASEVTGNLTEINGHFAGRAVTEANRLYQGYQLKNKGAFVFALETVTDAELELTGMVFLPPKADDIMALMMMATNVAGWPLFTTAEQAGVLYDQLAPMMMSEAHLAVIAPPRCAEMFAAFGPATVLY